MDEVRFWKACNLSPRGKRTEALALLDGISAHPQIVARAALKSADILLILGDLPEATARYARFISSLANVVEVRDRAYLLTYAEFFHQECLRRMGIDVAELVMREEVIIAARSASLAARSEFPPPEHRAAAP